MDLDHGKSYYLYVSKGYSNSQPVPFLSRDFAPIFLCGEAAAHPPDRWIHVPSSDTAQGLGAINGPYETFYRNIAEDPRVNTLSEELVARQGCLWIKPFENHAAFAPQLERPGIRCWGLEPEAATRFNDRLAVVRQVRDAVALPPHVIARAGDLPRHFARLSSKRGVFVAEAYGGGGRAAHICGSEHELAALAERFPADRELFMARALNLRHSLSIDVLIANPEEVRTFGYTEQIFAASHPLKCIGTYYPPRLTSATWQAVARVAADAGRQLARGGLRGHVNFDLHVDESGTAVFGELNARYAASTAERLLTMELSRPADRPTIPDLERSMIENGTFGGVELWKEPEQVFWVKKEWTAKSDGTVVSEYPGPRDEAVLFERFGAAVIGALPSECRVQAGKKLGKLVALARSEDERGRLIAELEAFVERAVVY